MNGPSLQQLEGEVEAARAKLAADLARLRSPETLAQFTDMLKQEALEAKDALLDKAKSSVRSSIENVIEDVKGRVAANPAAALAIGAGIAWRLLRHPPVATALIGAGLVSLFRTAPARVNGQASAYLSRAKARLVEQGSDVAEMAKDKVASMTETVTEKATELAGAARERVEGLAGEAAATATQAASDAKAHAGSFLDGASETVRVLQGTASSAAGAATLRAGATADDWSRSARIPFNDREMRDKVLLGAAGLAVTAALTIAWQRGLSEHV
jgi:ElaB/YqjD/DUF883 family membrane-anchored ribosome-binding protein